MIQYPPMSWLPYILTSALTLSAYDICKKHSAEGNRSFTVLLLTSSTGFAATALALAASGKLAATVRLPPLHMLMLAAKSLIVGASWACAYWALKTLPVTVMAPIRATGPVWTTLSAIFLFSETPTPVQAAGFALAFAGCICFAMSTRREGLTLRTPAILLAIGATGFGAASALYDKLLLSSLSLPPQTVLFWFMGGLAIIYGAACLFSARLDKTPFRWRWTIPAVGVLLALSDFLYFTAISAPDARISILSTIRRTSVIGTFLIGGAVFREKNLLRKGIALLAILGGVVLLCLD